MRRCVRIPQWGDLRGAKRTVRPPTEKPGSCRNRSETIPIQQEKTRLPIRSYPQPQEPVEHQPFFRDLNIPNFFELRKQLFFEPRKLIQLLLPQFGRISVVDSFEGIESFPVLPCSIARRRDLDDVIRLCVASAKVSSANVCTIKVSPSPTEKSQYFLSARGGSTKPTLHESVMTQWGRTRMLVSGFRPRG